MGCYRSGWPVHFFRKSSVPNHEMKGRNSLKFECFLRNCPPLIHKTQHDKLPTKRYIHPAPAKRAHARHAAGFVVLLEPLLGISGLARAFG